MFNSFIVVFFSLGVSQIYGETQTNLQRDGAVHGWTLTPDIKVDYKIVPYPRDHKMKYSGVP